MTDRLAEIRARLDAATPGPWRAAHDVERIAVVTEDQGAPAQPFAIVTCAYHSDARLIAHAPADIAWLLDEVEGLRAPKPRAKKAA